MALIVVFHVHILLLKMVLWKRHHRHVVETDLALLTHSSVHANFWFHAFETGTYLINRLPSRMNDNILPFQKLFCHVPNYKILKVFGCLCFPFLRPYNNHKLEFRSTPCIFIGYNSSHHGYNCLDPRTCLK